MSSATEGAVIRYTIDSTEPTVQSAIYNTPLSLPDGTVVKAFAMKENLKNSQITTYVVDLKTVTCPVPTFRRMNNQLIMETYMVGGVIYYTMDGNEPTKEQGIRYEGPLTLTRNCTVKAIVVKEGYFDSQVAIEEITSFQVSEPTFTINGTVLTINCDTEDTKIYYGLNETPIILYQSPITLTDNRPVKVIAKRDGYTDSQVVEYTHSLITCEPATLDKYDGRFFTLSVPEGSTAYYTLDGSTPTTASDKYTGRTALTEKCTIKIVAVCDWKNDSEVQNIEIKYFSDDESAEISEAGQLQKALEWQDVKSMKKLKVSGPVNATDFAYIKSQMTSVEHLDLEDVTVDNNILPDEAFAGMQSLITFISPKNISIVGERILANCPKLAAVVWNAVEKMGNSAFGDNINPNMLVYVVSGTFAPSGISNRIIDGEASRIVLTDTEGNGDFYCPKAFTANKISYTHNYSMETGKGQSMGWETIALPFQVQKIIHESKGELMTFKQFEEAGSPEDGRPFWLRTLTENGFEDASSIEAYTPYIISMPNNPEYASKYNVAGNVTFSAENVEVGVTKPVVSSKGNKSVMSCFQKKDAASNVWALNVGQEYEGQPAGSMFVPSLRDAKPFEAYATADVSYARAVISLAEMMNRDNITDIDNILYDRSREMKDEIVKVYTISGILFKTGKRSDVMKQLPAGMYVVDGKKIVIKK